MLTAAGHEVTGRQIVRDDPREIEPMVLKLADPAATDAVLMTGRHRDRRPRSDVRDRERPA